MRQHFGALGPQTIPMTPHHGF